MAQYYSAVPAIPRLVVVGPAVKARAALLTEALSARRGSPVEVRVAERGDKRQLRELAERNARLALAEDRLRAERRRQQRVEALSSLQAELGLDSLPIRIEGFDVSNLGPDHTVASMVVFEGGAPKKSDYRKFGIRGDRSGGPDDFSGIEEVLRRRAERFSAQADLSPHDGERDESFAAVPDVILIDGGKGQLGAALRGLGPMADRWTAVVGLAKRLEEVFVPGRSDPLPIRPDSEAARLLQRVRDEAHRFALDFHRERRSRALTRSLLDELPGVGPARKRALLNHFGSPDRVASASREELEAVPGIPGKLARDIHRQLNRTG